MATSSRSDPLPPQRDVPPAQVEFKGPDGRDLLEIAAVAEQVSKRYQQQTLDRPLSRGYRAWKNQHAENSKYLGPAFKGRSRLFVPKTRAAVRKNLAGAASALFSTQDVVSITAQYEDDPVQLATAAVIKADMEYRLGRTSLQSGMPWFLISMGGCLDGQLTGVTISKQYWQYEVVERSVEAQEPLLDELGDPVFGPDGQPILQIVQRAQKRVTRDRPWVELIPIENVCIDPAAPWYDPIGLGAWYFCDYPMHITDVHAMMRSDGGKGGTTQWLEVDDSTLTKGRMTDERAGNRRAREGGADRYEDAKAAGELDIVWIRENFIRIDGVDWHFWSVGRFEYLSEPKPVDEVYPEQGGERPYKMGVTQLDTHQVFPMTPVESWAPLQLEINDIANLRIDTLKRSIAPIAKVKRGRNVDLQQVLRRGQPETVIQVDAADDVTFESTPGVSGAAYTESSVTSTIFDELAGVFSTSSVQNSRSLNDTVGGMRLMAGASNAVSEFDLRIWVETWVEPVLRQVAHLIRYYESDEKILAIAASKAQVMTKYKLIPPLEAFDQTDLAIRVNVGTGATDPMHRLGKLKAAFEMLAPIQPILKEQGISLKGDQLVEEVMGAAGFRDGKRFFEFGEPQQGGPPPEMIEVMKKLELEQQKLDLAREKFLMEIQAEAEKTASDNMTKLKVEQIRQQGTAATQMIASQGDIHIEQERNRTARLTRLMDALQAGRQPMESPVEPAEGQMEQPEMPMAPPQQPDPQVMQAIHGIAQVNASILTVLAGIKQQLDAPAEVIRDQEGKAVGVRKAGRVQMIQRNPSGLIAGTIPLQTQPS